MNDDPELDTEARREILTRAIFDAAAREPWALAATQELALLNHRRKNEQKAAQRARLDALMVELGEPEHVRGDISTVAWRLGWDRVDAVLVRVREIEEAGGLWAVSTKARRTVGGVFFVLTKPSRRGKPRKKRKAAPAVAETVET